MSISLQLPKLEKPEHWRVWDKALKQLVQDLDATAYLGDNITEENTPERTLVEPQEPQLIRFFRVMFRKRITNQETGQYTLSDFPANTHVPDHEIEWLTYNDIPERLTRPSPPEGEWDLSRDDQNRYSMAMGSYRTRLSRYEGERKKILNIKQAILSSIGDSLKEHIKPGDTVIKIYRALESHTKPATLTQRNYLKKDWKALVKITASSAKGKNYETWANEVLATWSAAKSDKISLEDTEVDEAVTFLMAARKFPEGYAWGQARYFEVMEQGEDYKKTISDLVVQFKTVVRDIKSRNPRTGLGLPAIDQSGQSAEQPKRPKSKNRDSKEPLAPPTDWTTSSRTCLCGNTHKIDKCYVFHEKLRPENYKGPNTWCKANVAACEKVPALKKEIEDSRARVEKRLQEKGNLNQGNPNQGEERPAMSALTVAFNLINTGISMTINEAHPLGKCWILDSGSNYHVTNDVSRIHKRDEAPLDISLMTGNGLAPVEVSGQLRLTPTRPGKDLRPGEKSSISTMFAMHHIFPAALYPNISWKRSDSSTMRRMSTFFGAAQTPVSRSLSPMLRNGMGLGFSSGTIPSKQLE